MPYIDPKDRPKFRDVLNKMPIMKTKGELEYCIFVLMRQYMSELPIKYSNLHDTVYAAQHCADEFRRRFLDDREDAARASNGDIYSFEDECNLEIMLQAADTSGWLCKKCGTWWPVTWAICHKCGRSRKSQEGPNSW